MVVKEGMKVGNGSRIAVVGGGPSGAFCALYLRLFGQKEHIAPEITIFQQRDFNETGPKGCKGCAGILSASIRPYLTELDLELPGEVVQNEITAFTIHSPHTSISIANPEPEKEIASIYRGSGPRQSHGERSAGFDSWLLDQVIQRGIEVVPDTVTQISPGPQPSITVAESIQEFDLVVLAAGVGTKKVPINGLDYVPPRTRTASVDELYAGVEQVKSKLGDTAHGFLIPHLGVVFGALVPKGPFITVTVLSDSKTRVTVEDFLRYDIVQSVLPDKYERSCGCRPKAVVGMAKNYFGDRFVAIGDSAVSKLYLDGMTSSLVTGRQAACTAIYHGISGDDFKNHYKPVVLNIERDNRWGRFLFSLNHRAKDSPVFLRAQHRLTGLEQKNTSGNQPFTKAAWGMLTGNYSYTDIGKGLLNPAFIMKLTKELIFEKVRSLFHSEEVAPRKLDIVGRKVLILGSGFGGTYALRNLVKSLNLNENIETTMVSNENYFLFTPLLHEVASGRIEMRHIAYPIRSLHWKDRFNFIQASIEKIDLDSRRVITGSGVLDFDYLVLALGSITDVRAINPDTENVFMLKTLSDGMNIRNHIIKKFEEAGFEKDPDRCQQMLTFIVAGAGYTGVQVVTGLRDLVFSSLPRYYKTIDRNCIRIILIEAASKIVSDLDSRIGAYVMDYLKDAGIEVRLQSRVTRAWEGGVEINDDETIVADTIIWSSGVVANPCVAELPVAKDASGRVFVNEYLEIPAFPGVYAVGDCAHIRDPRSGRPIPPLAHTAVRQARIAAKNILSDIRGLNRKKYRYSKPPDMINLGSHRAAFRYRFIRLYGLIPRFIIAGAYLLLVTGLPNRIKIVTDWTLSMLFGRDTTFLR